MSLLRLKNVSIAFGHEALLQGASLEVAAGQRVCVIGRNGAGKSTLFRIIDDSVQADEGEVWRRAALRIAHLRQDVPEDDRQTVYEAVAKGLGRLGEMLAEYHTLSARLDSRGSADLARLAGLQHDIEVARGWTHGHRVENILTRLSLPADRRISECSGGIRRRVLLAQAMVGEPELLLLDEPTNHMDIDAIRWLEGFLREFKGALIFITHDRRFLQALATNIVELDRGSLTRFDTDFQGYLRRKQEMLSVEEKENARFDKKLAQEEVWIRKGIQARRTRNEGRVRALGVMREERARRLQSPGNVRLRSATGQTSGKLVVELESVHFNYGEAAVVAGFSTRLQRGDRVGIIGPNGSGKSTLLKLMLGELTPTSGTVVLGTKLSVAYFDQNRRDLQPEETVRDSVGEGSEMIDVGGHRRHVVSYLRDFLFPPQRIDAKVSSLSGGERNRLMLARLFSRESNLLVLDEPTNDLDVETLELLEEFLGDYTGTVLLVSHDRAFLDNVVTSTIAFEADGGVREYVGGYDDWLRQSHRFEVPKKEKSAGTDSSQERRQDRAKAARKKLSFKETRELAALPGEIEVLEGRQQDLDAAINRPTFYQQGHAAVAATLAELSDVHARLAKKYSRWEDLENIQAES